jgi:16S rRNA (guanine1207-N2)-methyltransferase
VPAGGASVRGVPTGRRRPPSAASDAPTTRHDVGAPSHYFDAQPATGSARREVPLVLPDRTVDLVTDRAVFSGDRVDAGTRYLLLEAPAPPATTRHALDLGCGYGPIAVTLAHRAPAATVWAVDANERAVALCAENAARLGLGNVRTAVVGPEQPLGDLPQDVRFDVIWSNPPIRIGKAALHELLARWLDRLAAGGHAYLVVHKHLGSDSLQRWLVEQGWTATRVGSRAGYRLLDVSHA